MATINLATKFLPFTDEQFKAESKASLLTNQDYTWTGAHSIKVYKVGVSKMTGRVPRQQQIGAASDLLPAWMQPQRS